MADFNPIKPSILYAVPPREGHMRPALQICTYLISRGFDVTILGTPVWKSAIEAIGAHHGPIIGLWSSLDDPARWPRIVNAPTPAARLAVSLDEGFITLLPSGLESVRFTLADMRRQNPDKKIVVLSDTCLSGTMALKLGSDLPLGFESATEIKTLGIGVVPVYWADPVRPPWGSGLPFDDSETGKARNIEACNEVWDQSAEDRGRMVLNMLACTKTLDELYVEYPCGPGMKRPFWDASTVCHDATLQMGLPSLEYPASNWPSKIKFAGALPIKPVSQDLKYPDWFEEILRNGASVKTTKADRKKIVFVAQGTEVLDYRELVIPTIQAFAGREDILVVAVLCVRGATLDASSFTGDVLPGNARILDYFPYDAVLAHADVFVSNSGYGGLTHAVSNGVPMIQTGNSFDKADIGRRVEWSGLGVFLPNPPPSPCDVKAAVDEVLGKIAFKSRALELKEEAKRFNPLEIVEKEILTLAE